MASAPSRSCGRPASRGPACGAGKSALPLKASRGCCTTRRAHRASHRSGQRPSGWWHDACQPAERDDALDPRHDGSADGVPTANPRQLTAASESGDSSLDERCLQADLVRLDWPMRRSSFEPSASNGGAHSFIDRGLATTVSATGERCFLLAPSESPRLTSKPSATFSSRVRSTARALARRFAPKMQGLR
jgi:hypothetical protein